MSCNGCVNRTDMEESSISHEWESMCSPFGGRVHRLYLFLHLTFDFGSVIIEHFSCHASLNRPVICLSTCYSIWTYGTCTFNPRAFRWAATIAARVVITLTTPELLWRGIVIVAALPAPCTLAIPAPAAGRVTQIATSIGDGTHGLGQTHQRQRTAHDARPCPDKKFPPTDLLAEGFDELLHGHCTPPVPLLGSLIPRGP